MRNYTPDAWVVVEITHEQDVIHKVLAGFYGGYLGGDSWKLNSGIEKIVEHDEFYDVIGLSGSSYICYKNAERMSGIMCGIFSSFEKQMEELNGKIEIVEMTKVLNNYKDK